MGTPVYSFEELQEALAACQNAERKEKTTVVAEVRHISWDDKYSHLTLIHCARDECRHHALHALCDYDGKHGSNDCYVFTNDFLKQSSDQDIETVFSRLLRKTEVSMVV